MPGDITPNLWSGGLFFQKLGRVVNIRDGSMNLTLTLALS